MKRPNPLTLLAISLALLTSLSCDQPNPTAPPDGIQPSLATAEAVEVNGGYEAIYLGTLGGTYSQVRAINALGQVTGTSQVDGVGHAFLWERGEMIDLGTLGGNGSDAWGMNDRGQVVGCSRTTAGNWATFLWEQGEMLNLGTMGADQSCADGINARGQVVGYSQVFIGDTFVLYAYLWEDGEWTDLGNLGGSWNNAIGINARGQIVGITSTTGFAGARGFLWEDGVGMIGLGASSIAEAINDRGQVVAQGGGHSFLWEDGVMTDLGEWWAEGINVRGQVVGQSCEDLGGGVRECQATLWENGEMIGLGIPFGRESSSARGINEHGQVVGESCTRVSFPPPVFECDATLWTKRTIRE